MFTVLGLIIAIIWIVIEECKKKPSKFYVGFKEFATNPGVQDFANNHVKIRNKKKAAKKAYKTRKKQLKRQRRQTTNLIIAHHCAKEMNNFVFGNNTRR